MFPFALLLAVPPADPPSVHYTAPENAKTAKLEEYDFDKWEVGQSVFVASDEVNLRKTANATADKVGTLAMGTAVTIKTIGGGAVQINDRVDRWYEIEAGKMSGFVFGGALTPIRIAADLDGDGEEEIATVAMTWNFKIRVRVLEPSITGAGRVIERDFEPAGGAMLGLRGGSAKVALLAEKDTGVPLLQIDSQPEACSDYARIYVSYASPEKKGKLEPALSLFGMIDGDIYSTFEVQFLPKASQAIVTFEQSEGDTDKKGKPITTKRREKYQLHGRVFEKI